jgi:hypothetical protein
MTTTTITAKTNAHGAAVVQLRSGEVGVATVTAMVGSLPTSTKSISITFQADKPVDEEPVVEVPIETSQDTILTLEHEQLQGVTITVRLRPGTIITDSNGIVQRAYRLRVTSIATTTVTSLPTNALGRFFRIELLDQQENPIDAAHIAPPLAITISVKNAQDMTQQSLDRIGLVYQKANGIWATDGIEVIERNELLRTLTLTTDHLTLFGLVQAETQNTVYLPIIQRS